MPPNTSPNIFTVDELATYLKVPKSTVYKLAQEGKIPGQKVGRHWRFQRQAIDQWVSNPTKARTKVGAKA
jgi:excisionase family DNA binding protein